MDLNVSPRFAVGPSTEKARRKKSFAFFFLQGAMSNRMANHGALFVGTLTTENQVIATPGKRKIKKTIRCKRSLNTRPQL